MFSTFPDNNSSKSAKKTNAIIKASINNSETTSFTREGAWLKAFMSPYKVGYLQKAVAMELYE
jgi:hypothetical protein